MIECQSIANTKIVHPIDEALGWYGRGFPHNSDVAYGATDEESFYQEARQALKMFIIDKTEEDFLI